MALRIDGLPFDPIVKSRPFVLFDLRGTEGLRRSCQMSSRKKKKFDAVELMRSIRDRLVRETEGLSVDEELRWLRTAELSDPKLARLAARAAQVSAPAAGRKPK